MVPPDSLLKVWRLFDGFPMETLTKAWFYNQPSGRRQRTVREMIEHRNQFGTSGNCFDLAIWLLHELKDAGIEAHAIGSDFGTPEAHVGVLAYVDGYRYLCDLGDQWILPILIDSSSSDFITEPVSGFFPAANVQVCSASTDFEITYQRPNGKISRQQYSLSKITDDELFEAGHFSQNLLSPPLCEMRIHSEDEVQHWEFYNWASFLSTNAGLFHDSPLTLNEEWSERIYSRTGISPAVVNEALDLYAFIFKK
ncbi:hypothetical protein DRW41_08960 [Neobacillus piezotolerans]|uniref:Arylamine N-acetyltransferase n=1 Tax=Neobacillus piezotolerans TaxID=2259171 RepID=A0A3D8GUN4_9BACI|nr:hypothetical protein [Neobacillus piezotolerans]RDU37929.1 hypothetical protein DRW41_08960 [Neobacillus piezotolerans]